MPADAMGEASVKKSTPMVFRRRAARVNCWTSGRAGSVSRGVAWDASQVEEIGLELVGAQDGKDFPADGFLRFSGDGAAVDINSAGIGDDVWLGAAPDDTDVDGGTAEQGMPGLFQAGCVVREEHVHDPCHAVDGAGAEVRGWHRGRPCRSC